MLYSADRLKKIFKKKVILNLTDLHLEREQIYALIGANGAGKTTLLNILAFLEPATEGTLLFCDREVKYREQELLRLRRRVVLVEQYPILFTRSVWKNVAFGLKVRGLSKSTCRERVEEALENVGMEDFRYADAHRLSGGESKRVALARALAVNPEVLLLDEPTANVDSENQEIILRVLKKINTEKGTSIVMATHYLAQSRQLAHQAILLENGMLSTVNTAKQNDLTAPEKFF